jgi:6,7-dimethyl-8-ribityllumazine synthase
VPQISKGGKERPQELPGLSSKAFRFAIAASRTNAGIVDGLLGGALAALERTGTSRDDVRVVRVPGAFELPFAAARLARRYDAVIALGCVIRGETEHFEHVSRGAADGLQRVALDSGVPLGFGVLTADTVEQAEARARTDERNLGYAAAMAAVEMVSLLERL